MKTTKTIQVHTQNSFPIKSFMKISRDWCINIPHFHPPASVRPQWEEKPCSNGLRSLVPSSSHLYQGLGWRQGTHSDLLRSKDRGATGNPEQMHFCQRRQPNKPGFGYNYSLRPVSFCYGLLVILRALYFARTQYLTHKLQRRIGLGSNISRTQLMAA